MYIWSTSKNSFLRKWIYCILSHAMLRPELNNEPVQLFLPNSYHKVTVARIFIYGRPVLHMIHERNHFEATFFWNHRRNPVFGREPRTCGSWHTWDLQNIWSKTKERLTWERILIIQRKYPGIRLEEKPINNTSPIWILEKYALHFLALSSNSENICQKGKLPTPNFRKWKRLSSNVKATVQP